MLEEFYSVSQMFSHKMTTVSLGLFCSIRLDLYGFACWKFNFF